MTRTVPHPAVRLALTLALMAGAALPRPLLAQAAGSADAALPTDVQVSAGLHPGVVRVGDRVVVTLRIQAPTSREVIVEELPVPETFEVDDVQDRSSVAVGAAGTAAEVREVRWMLVAWEPGTHTVGTARFWVDGAPFDVSYEPVQVQDTPLRRQARARGASPTGAGGGERGRTAEAPILPEGRPPPLGGEDAAVIPGGRPAGAGVVVTLPQGAAPLPRGVRPGFPGGGVVPGQGVPGAALPGAGVGGWGPGGWPPGFTGSLTTGALAVGTEWGAGVPGGWAETALQDPYWEEMVPRVQDYASVAEDPSGWIRLSAGASPDPVYVGQQLTFLATAGFAPEAAFRMRVDPQYFPPSPSDVWRVDVPRLGPGYIGAARGGLDDVRPFLQAFFPLRPGTLVIPAARLYYSLGGAGLLGPQDSLATAPLSVQVLPIPVDQAPPGWDGAVGRYRIGVALDREVLAPGESAVLTLTVRGAGNVDGLPAPRPTNLQGVVLRPLGERAVVEARDGVVGGVKVFQWLVSVAEPGLVSLGPFLLPYFDPWAGVFDIAATQEILLEGVGEQVPG